MLKLRKSGSAFAAFLIPENTTVKEIQSGKNRGFVVRTFHIE
jgi:hypothetical protein